ncbi:hypothetical protein [Sinorhizobium saheli]|uniref:hypothetical protein n=1 Tax=Sinorhizobium saheli TaxID=36856 RepID=UPI000A5A0463|nr:hypothetical protein [Sinorhizobium saheli]
MKPKVLTFDENNDTRDRLSYSVTVESDGSYTFKILDQAHTALPVPLKASGLDGFVLQNQYILSPRSPVNKPAAFSRVLFGMSRSLTQPTMQHVDTYSFGIDCGSFTWPDRYDAENRVTANRVVVGQ